MNGRDCMVLRGRLYAWVLPSHHLHIHLLQDMRSTTQAAYAGKQLRIGVQISIYVISRHLLEANRTEIENSLEADTP